MKLFHRHTFDPEKWKLISRVDVVREHFSFFRIELPRDVGKQIVYSNACSTCGDLVFRRVKEIED